jgi:zinc transporter ZupT
MLLGIALTGILTAPFAYRLIQYRWGYLLQRGILLLLLILIAGHLLPESQEIIGWTAWVLAAMGFVLPWVVERFFHAHSSSSLVWVGFIIHGVFDGAALAPCLLGGHSVGCSHVHTLPGWQMPLAIFLHKLSESLVVYSQAKSCSSWLQPFLVIAALMGATLLGYWGAQGFLSPLLSHTLEGYLQAFLSGVLGHVALDRLPGSHCNHKPHHRNHKHPSTV